MVPPQRAAGAGVELFPDQVVQTPGFYTLVAHAGDTTMIALNGDRNEAKLEYRDIAELKNQWKQPGVFWADPADAARLPAVGNQGGFPIWKICVLFGVLMLMAETWLLARKQV